MNDMQRYSPSEHAEEVDPTVSANPHFVEVLNARLSRRKALIGAGIAAMSSVTGLGLAGCDSNGTDPIAPAPATPPPAPTPTTLGFTAVPKSTTDAVVVPTGYTATPMYSTGQALVSSIPAYAGDGSETGDSYTQRAGDQHDGMYYFGLSATGTPDPQASARGLLAMNHEALLDLFLHPNGPTVVGGVRTVVDEVVKEINAHGVSIVEVARPNGSLAHQVVVDSPFNRRITAESPMELRGPVRGSRFVVTRFSTNGQNARGTVNNCAHGYTPWGTYLTCEENWAGYFTRSATDAANRSAADNATLASYGISAAGTPGRHRWGTLVVADPADTRFRRWDITVDPTQPANGTGDFRNEHNTMGYNVEIDPYSPTSTPRKRTAMGRFGHEGAWPAAAVPGRPLVWYMGDDANNQFVYKYVSRQNWDPSFTGLAAGDRYLDDGILYAAVFNADGSGEWRTLEFGQNGLTEDNALYPFTSQAAVLVNTRLAASSLGATRMDRPEWGAVNPVNGEVYFTMTNNSGRGLASAGVVANPASPSNPRSYVDERINDDGSTSTLRGNVNGHIIRFRENGNDPTATRFVWDIYAFGAEANADPATINLSGLSDDNDFSSPDGLWFHREGIPGTAGLLWVQTDDGASVDRTNNQMLAAVPGTVGDGGSRSVSAVNGAGTTTTTTFIGAPITGNNMRRFLVGVLGSEITGVDCTPDGRTMFVNVQHPGEDTTSLADPTAFQSHFPDGGTARPRSSTVVVTRNNGGIIGIA